MRLALPIELHAGHPNLNIDGRRWVLDTGAPVSFGDAPSHPLESSIPFVRNPGDIDAEDVSRFLGVPVAGVIGADFLNRHDHCLDFRSGRYEACDRLASSGHEHTLSFPAQLRGLPTIKARIGEEEGDFLFDTGAQLSYHVGRPPAGHGAGEEIWDFWLGLSQPRFRTRTHEAEVTFADYTITLRFGEPPDGLHEFLLSLGLRGVIGIDLIARNVCWYAPRRRSLQICR
jgi:hypothetical protein